MEKDLFNEIGRKFNAEFILSVVVILPLRLSVNDIFKRRNNPNKLEFAYFKCTKRTRYLATKSIEICSLNSKK